MGKFPASRLARLLAGCAVVCLYALALPSPSYGYAVLTHEAIIDAEWEDLLKPLLLERFPHATPEQLREAQSYAYGGSVIQDMGYYPFGSRFFSHLTHYVRSGDFVMALFEESRNLDDYAFALGALSHYVADIEGHSLAVNRSVPMLYPSMHKKYGDWVTWEQSPWAHSLTEFGFDTLEVVDRHVAPQKYHDWIGFRVPRPVLEPAFKKTYGIELSHQILSVRVALFSYRELAGQAIPEMSDVTWALRRRQLEARAASFHHQHLYHLSRKSYAAWRNTYTRPGLGDTIEALIFWMVPKIGPLNVIQFHTPTVETEQLFADSLRATVQEYDREVTALRTARLNPPDVDLDTGRPSRPREYVHGDRTYAELLHKLEREHFASATPALRDNLLRFFGESPANSASWHRRQWRRILRELDDLRSSPISPASPTTPTASVLRMIRP